MINSFQFRDNYPNYDADISSSESEEEFTAEAREQDYWADSEMDSPKPLKERCRLPEGTDSSEESETKTSSSSTPRTNGTEMLLVLNSISKMSIQTFREENGVAPKKGIEDRNVKPKRTRCRRTSTVVARNMSSGKVDLNASLRGLEAKPPIISWDDIKA